MRRLKARGVSIVFISHALEEALAHADRITILRDGELVVTGDAKEFDREKIVRAMVGRTLSGEIYNKKRGVEDLRKPGARVLSVQDISMGATVRNNSFSIYEGQITGVFGLIGSGRTETFKVVSGIYKRDFFAGGNIELDAKPVRYTVPREAVRDGIIYVTEDRKAEGLLRNHVDRGEPLFPACSPPIWKEGLCQPARDCAPWRRDWTAQLIVKAINDNARVVELSGGQPARGGNRQGPDPEAADRDLR